MIRPDPEDLTGTGNRAYVERLARQEPIFHDLEDWTPQRAVAARREALDAYDAMYPPDGA